MGANKTPVHQLEVNKGKQSQMQIQMVGVKGCKEDRTASDQAEKNNKALEDIRLGIQDF